MPKLSSLNQSYISEIEHAFEIFDEERTGYISINSFKLLIRSLGFRATKQEVFQEVYNAKQRQGIIPIQEKDVIDSNNSSGSFMKDKNWNIDSDVDLDIALDVMASKYTKRDPALEMKLNFRLFDLNNDGFLNIDDLKQTVSKFNEDCEERGMEKISGLGEDQLRAMIDEFDSDLDGMISQEDFRRILQG